MIADPWALAGWVMVHSLWSGTAFAAPAVIGRWMIRSASPQTRYAYALVCLAILSITPMIVAARIWPESRPDRAPIGILSTLPMIADEGPLPFPTPSLEPAVPPMPTIAPSRWPDASRLVGYLPALWLIGCPLTFAWMSAGLAGAERLRWASRPVVDPDLLSRLQTLAEACGVARKVALATCDRIKGPILVGILRPAILLPASALSGWSPEQLEMALRHELIHVRRWDNLVNLIQRSIESLLFFHPAVWLISSWIRTERERCCDAEVVRLTGRPEAYAEALLATATSHRIARPTSLAMAESDLVGRIRQLLNPEENAMKLPRLPISLAGVLLFAPMVGMVVWARMPPDPSQQISLVEEEIENTDDDPKPPAQDQPRPDQPRLDLIRETLAARKASGVPLTTEEQRAVARSLARLGDRPGAWAFLREEAEHAGRPGTSLRSAYVRIARIQREAGDQQGALASFRRAVRDEENAPPDPQRIYALSTITREFSELGAKEDARDAARRCVEEVGRFERPEDRRSLIPYIADCWAGARDLDRAFAVLDAIELPFGAESEARKLRAEGLARMAESYPQDDRPAARDAYARIEARAREGLDSAERDGVRAAVARGLAGIGDVDGALRMARSIGDEVRPERDPALERAKAIHSLYRALAQLPEPERRAARTLLQPAIREALDIVLPREQDTIEVSLLSSMGMTLASLDDFESALKAAEALPPGDRKVLLQVIGVRRRLAGQEQASRQAFRMALDDVEYRRTHPRPAKLGRPPVSPDQDAAFWIVDIRGSMGEFEEARKVAMTLENPASRWRALSAVASHQAQQGQGRAALEWCRANPAPRGLPDPMEGVLINLQFFRENAEAHAPAAPPAQDNPRPDQARLGAVREILAARKPEKKPATIEKGLSFEEIQSAARALANLGDRDGAWDLLRRSSDRSLPNWSSVSRTDWLCKIGRLWAELGFQEEALYSLRRGAKYEVDLCGPEERIRVLPRIARALNDLGDREEAREVARRCGEEIGRLKSAGLRRALSVETAKCWVAAGDLEEGFRLIDAILDLAEKEQETARLKLAGLAGLADVLPDGDGQASLDAFRRIEARMWDLANRADPMDIVPCLGALARGMARIGEVDSALRLARSVPAQPGKESRAARLKAHVLSSLAHAVIPIPEGEAPPAWALEAVREALALALNHAPEVRPDTLFWGLGMDLVNLKDVESARRASDALDVGYRSMLLTSIASVQRRAGDDAAARESARLALEDIEYARVHALPEFPRRDREQKPTDQVAKARIAEVRAVLGEYESAREMAMTIGNAAARWAALGDVAAIQARSGDLAGAMEWCRKNPPPSGIGDPMQALLIGLSTPPRKVH